MLGDRNLGRMKNLLESTINFERMSVTEIGSSSCRKINGKRRERRTQRKRGIEGLRRLKQLIEKVDNVFILRSLSPFLGVKCTDPVASRRECKVHAERV